MADRGDTPSDGPHLGQQLVVEWLAGEAVPKLVISDILELLWANAAAQSGDGHGCELDLGSGFLTSRNRQCQSALARFALACGAEIATLCLPCDDARAHLLFRGREIGRRNGRRYIGVTFFRSDGNGSPHYADIEQVFGLTPSEHRVLLAMIEGETADAIAARTGVSVDTVRTHIRHIYGKLAVSSREGMFARIQAFRV